METFYEVTGETERMIRTDIGNYKIERRDPHSHWFLVPETGSLPKVLEGAFTIPSVAYQAVVNYVTNKKK